MNEEFDLPGFGARVREARKARGLTQTQLADLIGVALSAVTDWETGKRAPREAEVIVRLARALRITTDELLRGEAGWREWVRGKLMALASEATTVDLTQPRAALPEVQTQGPSQTRVNGPATERRASGENDHDA